MFGHMLRFGVGLVLVLCLMDQLQDDVGRVALMDRSLGRCRAWIVTEARQFNPQHVRQDRAS
jgi:hypothetical protein